MQTVKSLWVAPTLPYLFAPHIWAWSSDRQRLNYRACADRSLNKLLIRLIMALYPMWTKLIYSEFIWTIHINHWFVNCFLSFFLVTYLNKKNEFVFVWLIYVDLQSYMTYSCADLPCILVDLADNMIVIPKILSKYTKKKTFKLVNQK